jgi:hypothetical protein
MHGSPRLRRVLEQLHAGANRGDGRGSVKPCTKLQLGRRSIVCVSISDRKVRHDLAVLPSIGTIVWECSGHRAGQLNEGFGGLRLDIGGLG